MVQGSLWDIAYTNGALYGVSDLGVDRKTLRVLAIEPSGATSTVAEQTVVSNVERWRLSGIANGSQLLAVPFQTGNNPLTFAINPASRSIATGSIAQVRDRATYDTVFSSDGNTVTFVQNPDQTITSFPGGVIQGVRPRAAKFPQRDNGLSDEFVFDYPISQPAAATATMSLSVNPIRDGLVRSAGIPEIRGEVAISNFVVPDSTNVRDVVVSNLVNVTGPGTATISTMPNSQTSLALRSLGSFQVSVDLNTSPRGIYSINAAPTITGTYAADDVSEKNRAISVSSQSSYRFGYDPVSANVVGNGDAALGMSGWRSYAQDNPSFQIPLPTDPTNNAFMLQPASSSSVTMRQLLQLPTPDSDMLVSFDYRLNPGYTDPVRLEVLLNGVKLADVVASSNSFQHYQMTLSDPAFRNLIDASFNIRATTSSSKLIYAEIGNIVLTTVPEPSVATDCVLAAASISFRRRRSS